VPGYDRAVPPGMPWKRTNPRLRRREGFGERELIQEVQLGLCFFQGLKSGLQMRCLKIVEVRPAKHVVDDRFGRLDPFLRPAQDGQRKRPSGRIAVDAGARGGHG
jgi:hypothetical protein